uniref:Uncharacterized protein n=1 Tax=Anguilla anguilla TaxID=7936 RepID=A0A0E9WS94_ANGAN
MIYEPPRNPFVGIERVTKTSLQHVSTTEFRSHKFTIAS